MIARGGLLSRLLVSDFDLRSGWPGRLVGTVLAWLFVAWLAMLARLAGPSFVLALLHLAPFAAGVWAVREFAVWHARHPTPRSDRWREREERRGR